MFVVAGFALLGLAACAFAAFYPIPWVDGVA